MEIQLLPNCYTSLTAWVSTDSEPPAPGSYPWSILVLTSECGFFRLLLPSSGALILD